MENSISDETHDILSRIENLERIVKNISKDIKYLHKEVSRLSASNSLHHGIYR